MLTGFVILIQILYIFYSVNINSISLCFPVISARVKLKHRFLLCRIGSICPGRTNEKIRKAQRCIAVQIGDTYPEILEPLREKFEMIINIDNTAPHTGATKIVNAVHSCDL